MQYDHEIELRWTTNPDGADPTSLHSSKVCRVASQQNAEQIQLVVSHANYVVLANFLTQLTQNGLSIEKNGVGLRCRAD